MKCPSCSAEHPQGSAECSACGIIFEKWYKRTVRPVASAPAVAQAAAPASSGVDLGGIVSKIIQLAVLAGVVYAYFHFKDDVYNAVNGRMKQAQDNSPAGVQDRMSNFNLPTFKMPTPNQDVMDQANAIQQMQNRMIANPAPPPTAYQNNSIAVPNVQPSANVRR